MNSFESSLRPSPATVKILFTKETPIGTKTNMGTLTGFHDNAFAVFDYGKSWAGPDTFKFIQIR